ncbi:hypothetical protein [Carbonactinospora thermoautotrophica]|nr:hypothetical protein [Carbonactinospora thermoautotrophica]
MTEPRKTPAPRDPAGRVAALVEEDASHIDPNVLVSLSTRIPAGLRLEIRQMALLEGRKAQELIIEALQQYVERRRRRKAAG